MIKLNEDSRDESINIFPGIYHHSITGITLNLSNLEASRGFDGLLLASSSQHRIKN